MPCVSTRELIYEYLEILLFWMFLFIMYNFYWFVSVKILKNSKLWMFIISLNIRLITKNNKVFDGENLQYWGAFWVFWIIYGNFQPMPCVSLLVGWLNVILELDAEVRFELSPKFTPLSPSSSSCSKFTPSLRYYYKTN